MSRESGVDEQTLASADRMSTNDRMPDRRVFGHRALITLLESRVALPAFRREGFGNGMLGSQSIQQAAQRLGKRFVRGGIARPHRVATRRRRALRCKYPCERRRLTEGDVGMPVVVIRQKSRMVV